MIGPFIWTNFKQLHPRMQLSPVVLEEIFKCHQYIFTLSLISPLIRGCGPSLEQIWVPFTKVCFITNWVKLTQWFWRRRKCENFMTTKDNEQTVIRKVYLSLWLRCAKNQWKLLYPIPGQDRVAQRVVNFN